ncbi:unnamed protein product, partial [marine sediment metagenome]
ALLKIFISLDIQKTVTATDRKSEIGTANHTPFSPKIKGSRKAAGIKNNTCLDMVKIRAGAAFPIA